MAFYNAASNASLWRGIDYYRRGNVLGFSCADDGIVVGAVKGSGGSAYDVTINREHPRKSTCSCPFAKGRRVICKHMVALYFASTPGSYEAFEQDMRKLEVQYELEEKRWREETRKRIETEVAALSAKEARVKLAEILYNNELEERYRDDDKEFW